MQSTKGGRKRKDKTLRSDCVKRKLNRRVWNAEVQNRWTEVIKLRSEQMFKDL